MKTKVIKCVPPKLMTIAEFAELHDLTMVLREHLTGWNASFERAEVMVPPAGLLSEYGRGATPDAAIEDYAVAISGRRLAIDAYTDKRREITVPLLRHEVTQ